MTFIHPILLMLLEANAVLAVFVLAYLVFFKKLTHFSFNRYLLLAAVFTSILIGSVNYQHIETVYVELQTPTQSEAAEEPIVDTIAETQLIESDTNQQSGVDQILLILLAVVCLGSAFHLGKFFVALASLFRATKNTRLLKGNIYIGANVTSAFSFYNRIYVPNSYTALAPEKLDVVIAHEQRHLDLKHSLDAIFIALAKPMFWYNPLFAFLQKELKIIHEFQADEHVMKAISKPVYSNILLELTELNPAQNSLYHSFSMFGLKRRINTMQFPATGKFHKFKYLIMIPIVASLGYAFSFQTQVEYQFTSEPTESGSAIVFQLPISKGNITSLKPFGPRVNPLNEKRQMHKGVDLVAPLGTPILAAQSGKVRSVITDQSGYGIRIVIDHNDSLSTSYSHLQKATVKQGQEVQIGQQIATCGSTGRSTGPHLHFEVMVKDEVKDPKQYFIGELEGVGSKDKTTAADVFTIILDAGHGGKDAGNSAESSTEKDLNLKTVLMLKEKLEAENVNVVLTRSTDEYFSLKERTDFTAHYSNSLFVSIHANASENENASGIDLYVPKREDERFVASQKLAQLTEIQLVDQEFKVRGIQQADYFVLKESLAPALLFELGFMTNSDDFKTMNSPEQLDKMCEALAKSIVLYSK